MTMRLQTMSSPSRGGRRAATSGSMP
jgi:hypothetical protein